MNGPASMRRDIADRIPSWAVLLLLVAATAMVGWLGQRAASTSIDTWYAGLAKPGITPPGGVFAPVWTALYLMMALAAWVVVRSDADAQRKARALRAFWIQLALNLAWPAIFFGARDPGWAFLEILILLAAIAVTTIRFAAIERRAGLLLLPYLGWTGFAALLNFLIWRLNLKS